MKKISVAVTAAVILLVSILIGYIYLYPIVVSDSYQAETEEEILMFPETVDEETESSSQIIDSDQDGLNDELEAFLGTDPQNPDTDGDGYLDGVEIENDYDPLGDGRL